MKILFVSEYYPPKIMGGGEINLSLLAETLADKNDIHIITSIHENLEKFEIIKKVKIHRLLKTASDVRSLRDNFERSIKFPRSVISEVKKLSGVLKPNIIHFIGTTIITAKELSKLNIPLVATIESYPSLCPKGDRIYQGKKECKKVCSFIKFVYCQKKSPEIGKMENKNYLKYNPPFHGYLYNYFLKLRKSLKYCNLIAISDYVSKVLLQHGLKSEVIPNILEIEKFNLKKVKNKKPVVLYVGALIKSKGPDILLEAVRDIDCKVRLYGRGILKDQLQNKISKYKLDAKIYEHVSYEKMPKVYNNADLVVFPSVWPEPFGRIPIEAMAAAKKIIGSDIAGIKETIPSNLGMKVKPGDVNELKEAIKKSLLGTNNVNEKRKFVKRFSKQVVYQKFLDFYQSLH